MLVDFHMHTSLSDGACSPQRVYEMIRARGLAAWAITDHDLLDASVTYAQYPRAVIGCEVTTWEAGREVHVVALGMDPEDQGLRALLAAVRDARSHYLQALCVYLREQHGISELPIDAGQRSGSLIASRAHLAAWLCDHGLVSHPGAAFQRWLGDSLLPIDLRPDYPSLASACAVIQASGGLAILAHPAHYQDLPWIERLLNLGCLDGMETNHPGCDAAWRRWLRDLCHRHGLLESGGSDFHFPGKRRIGDHCHHSAYLKPLLARLGLDVEAA